MKRAPKLRFSEFSAEWEIKNLGSITQKVGSGKTPKGGNSVYTDSGIMFLRSQNILNGELLLNDVVYITEQENSKMKSTEVYGNDILLNITGGSIGRSSVVPIGFPKANVNQHVCILRLKEMYSANFIMNQILSHKVQKQIDSYQAGGNREGLNFEQIKHINVATTSHKEQEKIALFLLLIDKKIQNQKDKIEALKLYKKGIMKKIFSQEIRFNDDNGKAYQEWRLRKLNELLFEHKERNYDMKYGKEDVLSVSGEYGIVNQIELLGRSYAGESVDNYHMVHKGDIVYTKSPLKSNPYGIIKVNKGFEGIVSTLYAVYSCKETVNGSYLDYYFELDDNTNEYIRPLVNKGAKNDMKINNEYFLSDKIIVPSVQEQEKIVRFISIFDRKLEKEQEKLRQLKELKKGLLQRMFV